MPSDMQFARGFAPYFERKISWFWVIWWENDSRFAVAAVQLKNISQAYWFFSQFVSLRRRELKCYNNVNGRYYISSSPYGDVSWNGILLLWIGSHTRSSPYGDVSWNISTFGAIPDSVSSSPYGDVSWNSHNIMHTLAHIQFVSLRRRELKYILHRWLALSARSSPYGDVSWNL